MVAGTNIRTAHCDKPLGPIVIVITLVIVWSGAEIAVTVWKMAVRVHIETVQPAIQQVHHEIMPFLARICDLRSEILHAATSTCTVNSEPSRG